ncbi:cytochrome c family protein [Rhizobium sp. S153]|uniref:Cytochrome c family protein n=1 Tax=Ciceribacter sichuanensis TaxID=2949647 RepID=A0ABT0V501_9HYPH|nr:cytochrome c family protein [Ciceribacter sp. S153]MCM2400507.1 cytochrome c family protein [Ciceribacter sp. S153]
MISRHTLISALIGTFATGLAAPVMAMEGLTGDAGAGEKVFRKCQACHAVGPGAVSKTGPLLTGVVGRPAGSIADYSYSSGMTKAAGEGLVWAPEKISEFLTNPKAFLPGTKMAFAGIRKDQERADLIAYLSTFKQ